MSKKTGTIELPAAGSLTELWKGLALRLRDGSEDPAWIKFASAHRRFIAGYGSFTGQSFSQWQTWIDRDRLHFMTRDTSIDPGSRRLRADATISFDRRVARLTCSGTQFRVYGATDVRYWTNFTGNLLDQLVAERFDVMFAIVGARCTAGNVEPNEREYNECVDLGLRPCKVWEVDAGRLVLAEDANRRGWFLSEGDTTVLQTRFRRAGWSEISAH